MSEFFVLEMEKAWRDGRVCLHPTDTLPGLSFDPHQSPAWDALRAVKQRPQEKSPIALVARLDQALKLWQALPGVWPQILGALWPGPLSVIWYASAECAPYLKSPDGTCALRSPLFSASCSWMQDLLERIEGGFPTTSVNRSGEAACGSWDEAVAWVQRYDPNIYVPPGAPLASRTDKTIMPSTLLRIVDASSYEILREGAMARSSIEKMVETYVRHI